MREKVTLKIIQDETTKLYHVVADLADGRQIEFGDGYKTLDEALEAATPPKE